MGVVLNRRVFLDTMGGLSMIGCAANSGLRPAPEYRLERVGIQLYSVRGEMERDVEGTLAHLASIGYREVEFAGYFNRTPQAVRTILRRHGLAAPSANVPIEILRRDWARTLEGANIIGHRYIVVPYLPQEDQRTLDDYKRVSAEFNQLGDQAKRAGIRLAYHNHDSEFVPLGGRIPYDVLLAETDPVYVALELDLFWATKAGQDPLAYFARHPGRFELVHVKDSSGPPEHRQVAVGQGVIDFRRILSRKGQAGIRHAFVEQDEPPDPFEFARASYAYLERLRF